jgi:hypothetical protein
MSAISERVAAMYWDPTDKTFLETGIKNKPAVIQESEEVLEPKVVVGHELSPDKLATQLRTIADAIDRSERPSVSLVAGDISELVGSLRTSGAMSMARNIRDKVWSQVLALFPSGTWDLSVGQGSGFHDTSEGGKGWSDGFVSFGAKPTIWSTNNIIGTFLFRFRYASKNIVPSKGTPEHEKWERENILNIDQNVVEVGKLAGGYYNKRSGGSVDAFVGTVDAVPDAPNIAPKEIFFGEAIFEIDRNETIVEWDWSDPSAMRSKIQSVIDDILRNPPIGGIGKPSDKKNPYGSITKFMNHLRRQRRNVFYKNEASLVAQSIGSVLNIVVQTLIKNNFKYDPSNSPFLISD